MLRRDDELHRVTPSALREELVRRFPALARLPTGAFVVGGAIRDLLLGREPLDVDITCVNAEHAARRVRDRVIQLGDAELSAYRVISDGATYDFAEMVGGAIETDLRRRDFTANAIAVDLASGALIDPHNGMADTRSRIVRMVRPSNFDDDPLRTLKAVRMAVKYEFEIEAETLDAIRARADQITEVAPERVTYELTIIFSSGASSRAIELLRETRLDQPLELRTGTFAADQLSLAGAFALLVDNPRANAERWRWSDALLRDVITLQRLAERHDRIALYEAGEELALQLPPLLRALGRDDALDLPDFSITPLLNGEAIAQLTAIAPGKQLGAVKRALVEAQVRGQVRTKEEAEEFVRRAADAGRA